MNWESGGVINTRVLDNSSDIHSIQKGKKKNRAIIFFWSINVKRFFFLLKQKPDIKALSYNVLNIRERS